MMSLHDQCLTLTKTDVIEKQLNTAIQLFFEERDPISIHTLISAVNGNLEPMAIRKGLNAPFGRQNYYVKDKYRKEWIDALNTAQNFFKHGDRDEDETLNFQTKITVFEIQSAICFYEYLYNRRTPEMSIFFFWYMFTYPETINEEEPHINEIKNMAETLRIDFSNKSILRKCIDDIRQEWGNYFQIG